MLTIVFVILMFMVFGKMLAWCFKAAWGIGKLLLNLVFFPVILIAMVYVGLIYAAIAVLIVYGIVVLIGYAKNI